MHVSYEDDGKRNYHCLKLKTESKQVRLAHYLMD